MTGAAHGQGRAAALALAREGVNIVALDIARTLDYPGYALGSPSPTWDRCGTLVSAWASNVCRSRPTCAMTTAVSAAVAAAADRLGRIDILFNNAGICAYGLAHEITEDAWDAMLDINLKGAWIVARRVIPHMIARQSGVIINNSSVAGLRGMARLSHYAASKWGLVGLTKSWAIELAPHGIRVVSIHPTGVNTPMNDGLAELEGLSPLRSRRTVRGQPAARSLGRSGRCRRGRRLPRLQPGPFHHRLPVRPGRGAALPLSRKMRRSRDRRDWGIALGLSNGNGDDGNVKVYDMVSARPLLPTAPPTYIVNRI